MFNVRKRFKSYTHSEDIDNGYPVASHWNVAWRFICFVMSIFFILSAYVQLNDPDPWLWIPAYLIPALLTLAVVIKRHITSSVPWKIVCDLVILLSVLNSLYLFLIVTGILKDNFVNPLEHEEGRELGGTLIVVVWLLALRNTSLESFEPNKKTLSVLVVTTGFLSLIPLIVWAACFHSSMSTRLGHCKDMFPGMLGDKVKF